jgi:hypothetical protein
VLALAAVEAALTGANALFPLRRDRNPVLYLWVPMQIAIVNYLAFFQNPRAGRGRGYCLFRLTHERAYSVIGKEKAERREIGHAVATNQNKQKARHLASSAPSFVTFR